jgi:dipeptidyl aminopeptidase/acylaminoacyl peptidase
MAYSMDVLALIEYAVGGFTPYENPDAFEKFNPINYVINWTQPMLIIHGGRDYRVPDTQGISAFTAAQRRGIPSRMLYLPTEGHSISNSFNLIRLHHEILDWIAKWTI